MFNSLSVGDGFIRPEVRTFVNSGQATSINEKRSSLGTDKSVPYKDGFKEPANSVLKTPRIRF
ncbi:MAG: hypothetical protein FWG87_00215 [Defluviitaleaceae bacterium]|nr:hypothetical protein [Defluviitaleaceae bacterium]